MSAPNLKEIEWAIEEIENSESSKENYIFLAALKVCRDEFMGKSSFPHEAQISAYAQASSPVALSEPLNRYGDSDFLRAVEGKNPADVWRIMDEHMRTLQAINRRSYNTVLEKIRQL